jgi:DNA-binding NarL/FixJ family response regulator
MIPLSQALNPSIRVLVADADRMSGLLIAEGITRGRNEVDVVAVASTSGEAIRELEKKQPNIALINAHLGDGRLRGYHVLRYLQMLSPKTSAIMLIPDSNRDLVVDSFRGGAKGVFCRLHSIKMLSKCIRTVHEGQIWADTRDLVFVLDFLTELKPLRIVKPGGGMTRLTPREAEVVHFLADGLSTREIGNKLALSEHTVRNYLSSIYDKLGVSSRVELALYAVAREDLPRRAGE